MEEALIEEMVEEILLRLPPDDPPSLVRAAMVCRRWRRIISDPGFRRRFGRCHSAAPVLGLLANLRDGDGLDDDFDFVARFVPTTPFRPYFPDNRDRCALDARHGRVLLTMAPLPPALGDPFSWNAAVLCAGHDACSHFDCHLGPFFVVLLDSNTEQMRVHLYSSEAEASQPTYGPPSPLDGVETLPTALVGNSLFFLIYASQSILEYDLATRNMSVIPLPPEQYVDFAVLMAMEEDGRLGFARLANSTLFIWSMERSPEGHAGWALIAAIDLETLLPVDVFSISEDYVGFAHGVGVFFVPMLEERLIFSIDLYSGRVRVEDCSDGRTHGVVPYTSFYTPDFRQYSVAPV
ncbi:unnamed protein product [Urochloa decumbens]|uniref:F-box domain-containing protein n=1 Tax=Urochloa decumbens TaxID=240449 RepID=A0ABC9FPN5_9POAL